MHGRLREEGGFLRYVDGKCLLQKTPSAGFIASHPFSQTAKGWATRVHLLADAELPNDRLIALGIVSLEVVQ
jgi:hypothetical protein